jgi:thioredoxin-related protein
MLEQLQNLNKLKNNGKNTLVFLHLEDCPWCHFAIDEVILPMTDISEYTNKLNIFELKINEGNSLIDFNDNEKTAEMFALDSGTDFYPTLLLFSQTGKLLEKIIGVVSQDNYWTDLDKIIDKYENT